jgi:UDP-galactopyranose mutase
VADVVVVGGGLAGLASAARLAKLGHRVTVCERTDRLGGAVRLERRQGFTWDAGPASTPLPAVLRDLFRKSGRPLERYLDLRLVEPARRHVFPDGSEVDLPAGSRGAQQAAVGRGLDAEAAAAWTAFVDGLEPVWEVLRTRVLDPAAGGRALADREVARALGGRTSLARMLRRRLPDDRLRQVAAYPTLLAGSLPRDTPAYAAVSAYVERSFGVWTVEGGFGTVTDALVTRLQERNVTLRLGTAVAGITCGSHGVTGVRTADGTTLSADVVVTTNDARTVFDGLVDAPATRHPRHVLARATPAIPPSVTHLGLAELPPDQPGSVEPLPDLPAEVVYHGDPLLVLRTGGGAPNGHRAWTLLRRGSAQEDPLVTLARRGLDVRPRVVTRVDRSPVDILEESDGSPYGLAWEGWRRAVARAGLGHPVPGLYCIGASMHPGAGVPYVAWGAAHVADLVGKA